MTREPLSRSSSLCAAALCVVVGAVSATDVHAADPRQKRHQEAAAISHVAHGKAKKGDMALAAQLYQQAWTTDKSVMAYLYAAGRCLDKAGDLDGAIAAYQKFLSMVTTTDPLFAKATDRLKEAKDAKAEKAAAEARKRKAEKRAAERRAEIARQQEAARKADEARKAKIAAEKAKKRLAEDRADRQMARIIGVSLGAVAAVGGGWFIYDASQMAAELESDLEPEVKGGKIVSMTQSEAMSRQDAINQQHAMGIGLVAAGLAAAGIVWAVTGEPDKVALVPSARGALVRVRF